MVELGPGMLFPDSWLFGGPPDGPDPPEPDEYDEWLEEIAPEEES